MPLNLNFFRLTMAAIFLPLLTSIATATDPVTRERISFNSDWRFTKDDPIGTSGELSYAKIKDWVTSTGPEFTRDPQLAARKRPEGKLGAEIAYTQTDFDDSGWRELNLPHDWGVEGPFTQEYPGETGKLAWWGVAWYRKHFTVTAANQGKQIYLDVDGAMAYATVWCNGEFVGGWPFGYASWRLDLTPHLKPGAGNVIAIRLDNPPASSRWYPGGGIYRNVWLVKTAPVHVAHWGTYITTDGITKDAATVNLQVTVENNSSAETSAQIITQIFAANSTGEKTSQPVAATSALTVNLPANSNAVSYASVTVPNPRLWDLKHPNRYVAVTTIEQGGKVVDTYETPFGVRTIQFTVDNGFLLNGERVPIQGVCDHHDLGPLGTALNFRALQRQIELLQSMGCNAIRTSHNPPAPELLELCDRMGMLVMDESFDCWVSGKGKNTNDYHVLFPDWHEKDLRALVRRDRNHPCVILWSIGNEIIEQVQIPEGHKVAAQLARIVHEEDPTRPVSAASNHTEAGYNGFQKIVDVFGYNYHPFEYGKLRAANPNLPIFGSETASTVSSRGEYFFPVGDDQNPVRVNFQVSSYDLYAPKWATTPDREFRSHVEFPYVAGEFVWTGFDYLGEPTPYWSDTTNELFFTNPEDAARIESERKEFGKVHVPSRSSYFGILDLCGFKKDRFYLYQAHWRPDFPMAHILPHWNWPERIGQITPVHVYTSGDEAELFLNGKSLGRKKKAPDEFRLRWDDVKYQPGELKVVAYKNGKKWAQDAVETTGPADRLTLAADRAKLKADGEDLSFVTVTIADAKGRLVPRSKNHVRYDISGPGEIIAVGNGDATSHESFKAKDQDAYNGLALVVIRSIAGQPGEIELHAHSDGLTAAIVWLHASQSVGR
jgi:beta-galactosidase